MALKAFGRYRGGLLLGSYCLLLRGEFCMLYHCAYRYMILTPHGILNIHLRNPDSLLYVCR